MLVAKAKPLLWLLLLTLACLVPFLDKAFHIDDTLFLRAAEQIQRHPLDFYGFQMNWSGTTRPMVENFDNPPLACYYIALVGSIAGWTEPVLHLAFLLPALAAAWGVFSLARGYCERPWLAGVGAVLTPVFLISATNVMCDVLLLAFWVWAVVFFENGLNTKAKAPLFAGGLLIGLAFWTKFTALALVPLLAAYCFCRERKLGWWAGALLVPLLFAGAYEYITFRLYGKGLFFTAASFSSQSNMSLHTQLLEKESVGLSFMGGCFLPALFYIPWLWSRQELLKGLCILSTCLLPCLWLQSWTHFLRSESGQWDWVMFLQTGVFFAAGILVIALAGLDFWTRRDARSLLLALWILGMFVFATRINWTINGRSFLPMLPAVALLIARRIDQRWKPKASANEKVLWWPGLGAAALCLFLSATDYATADGARSAAREIGAQYGQKGRVIWFEGHWGFQYYMEQQGAKPFERAGAWDWGDIVVVPAGGVNVFNLPEKVANRLDEVAFRCGLPCATMSRSAGAGFYASVWGPFPYSIKGVTAQKYGIFQMTQRHAGPVK